MPGARCGRVSICISVLPTDPIHLPAPFCGARKGVTIARRQEISVFDLSNVVATIQADNSIAFATLRIQHAVELSNLRDQ